MERALSSMGIGLEAMASEETLVPRIQACRFIDTVARSEGIDQIGLEVGRRTSVRNLGKLGEMLSRSLTLYNLLKTLVRLMPMVDTGCRVWVESGNGSDGVRLCYRPDDGIGRTDCSAFSLLGLIDAVRMAAGSQWRPKKVWLEKAAGSDLERFEALSDAAAERHVDYAAFEIPRDCLSLPLAVSDGVATKQDTSNGAYDSNSPPEDLAGTVVSVIRGGFGAVMPTVELVAEMTGASIRTLQRRLRAEGASYGELIDRTRFESAVSLVGMSDVPIAEIARHLGYSESAPFSVAFRRWTGESPSHYRARMRPG